MAQVIITADQSASKKDQSLYDTCHYAIEKRKEKKKRSETESIRHNSYNSVTTCIKCSIEETEGRKMSIRTWHQRENLVLGIVHIHAKLL